jgi:hypothetical protein
VCYDKRINGRHHQASPNPEPPSGARCRAVKNGGEAMIRLICMTLLGLSLATVSAAATVHCTTREDPALKRWVTTCTDG